MIKRDKLFLYLKQHRRITKKEAWIKFGLYNTGDAILKLRRAGHNIVTEWLEKDGARFANYYLVESVGENVLLKPAKR